MKRAGNTERAPGPARSFKDRHFIVFFYIVVILIDMKRKLKKDTNSYAVVFTPAEEGGYTATVPALPGCISEGDSFEKAKENIREAIELYTKVAGTFRTAAADFIIAPVTV